MFLKTNLGYLSQIALRNMQLLVLKTLLDKMILHLKNLYLQMIHNIRNLKFLNIVLNRLGISGKHCDKWYLNVTSHSISILGNTTQGKTHWV